MRDYDKEPIIVKNDYLLKNLEILGVRSKFQVIFEQIKIGFTYE